MDGWGPTEGGAPIGDFDPVELEGIQAQLHGQRAQAQIHFDELVVHSDGAVAAHGAGQLMIKEWVQVQMRVQGFDQVGAARVALGRRQAGAGMDADRIDTLQPEGELRVEFFEVAGALAGPAQTGFKILLNREKYPLGFSFDQAG